MSPSPRLPLLVALTASLLVGAGCHRRPAAAPVPAAAPAPAPVPPPVAQPQPFTGKLTEISGVQAVLSLRSPSLVAEDMEKLMNGVPETAMLRPFLTQLASVGYPSFSEFSPGSNVGVAILSVSGGDLDADSLTAIGCARMADGGKIGNLLRAKGLVLEKHGAWTLIAKDEADLAKLKSPGDLFAYLEKPQADDLRFWLRASPDLLTELKGKIRPAITRTTQGMTPARRQAAFAYFEAAYSLLSQLHSVSYGLALDETGVKLTGSAQFLPDSPAGTMLRYQAGPPPAVARHVSGHALVTLVVRQNPQAIADFANTVFDALIAVDYPSGAARLQGMKAQYDALEAELDGGGVAAFDLALADGNTLQKVRPTFFYAASGHVEPALARRYFAQIRALGNPLAGFFKSSPWAGNASRMVASETTFTDHALTVDGVSFDLATGTTSVGGKKFSAFSQYVGDADGNLVMADSEATLQERLPALRAKTDLPDAIQAPAAPREYLRAELKGGPLVDFLARAAKLDPKDPDIASQMATLKGEYAAAGPATGVADGGQARSEMVLAIPYKFIEATIHLSAYMSAEKLNLLELLAPALLGNTVGRNPAAAPPAPASEPSFANWSSHLARGRRLAAQGQPAEALAAYSWCYEKASFSIMAAHRDSWTALLSGVAELGEQYPPARQTLLTWRRQAEAALRARPRDFAALNRLLATSAALKDDAGLLAFYDRLPPEDALRATLGPALIPQFVAAQRYGDALKARPYNSCRHLLERFPRMQQRFPANAAFVRSQSSRLVEMGANEAEALAGLGYEKPCRQIVADVRAIDASPATLALLKKRLARAGHDDWAAP